MIIAIPAPGPPTGRAADFSAKILERELEYRIPRLHSPVNSRRFLEIFRDLCKNKTICL